MRISGRLAVAQISVAFFQPSICCLSVDSLKFPLQMQSEDKQRFGWSVHADLRASPSVFFSFLVNPVRFLHLKIPTPRLQPKRTTIFIYILAALHWMDWRLSSLKRHINIDLLVPSFKGQIPFSFCSLLFILQWQLLLYIWSRIHIFYPQEGSLNRNYSAIPGSRNFALFLNFKT